MPDKRSVEDPLKPLDHIYEPDERQKNFLYGLEDSHSDLSAIVLNKSVPIEVRQLFETAKNLSLYSWFVYRFHQVSELVAFSALEMALRERFCLENPGDQSRERPPTLYRLLQHAKSERWITNEGFPSLYERARGLAEYKKAIDVFSAHDFEKEPTALVGDPTDEEIKKALLDLDLVEGITSSAHKIRNDLAHGSSILHPRSIATLTMISELINQIYH